MYEFTHCVSRFSINFYGRNNAFKYRISLSSLSKSFGVSTLFEPNHCVPQYRDMWRVTK